MSKSKARKLAEFLRNLTDESKLSTSAVEQSKVVTTRADLESKATDTEALVTAASVTSYVGNKLDDYVHGTHDIPLTFTGDVTGSGTITDMGATNVDLDVDALTSFDQITNTTAAQTRTDSGQTASITLSSGTITVYANLQASDTEVRLILQSNLSEETRVQIEFDIGYSGIGYQNIDDTHTFTLSDFLVSPGNMYYTLTVIDLLDLLPPPFFFTRSFVWDTRNFTLTHQTPEVVNTVTRNRQLSFNDNYPGVLEFTTDAYGSDLRQRMVFQIDDSPGMGHVSAYRTLNVYGRAYVEEYLQVGDRIDSTITAQDVSDFKTAYTWGDHAEAGYLTTYTETNTTLSLSGNTLTYTDELGFPTDIELPSGSDSGITTGKAIAMAMVFG